MANLTLEGFKNFFKYYKGESHQQLGIEELYHDLPSSLKSEDSD